MELDNVRDLSSSGSGFSSGFQFEFYCRRCSRKWKSTFKPYRVGQFTTLVARLSSTFGVGHTAGQAAVGYSDYGSRKAREEALAEAIRQAEKLYTVCSSCKEAVCGDCLGTDGATCRACIEETSRASSASAEQAAVRSREQAASACPNCGTGSSGGRFCSECGFDMASTHKSCP
jgi:hypothetical protein